MLDPQDLHIKRKIREAAEDRVPTLDLHIFSLTVAYAGLLRVYGRGQHLQERDDTQPIRSYARLDREGDLFIDCTGRSALTAPRRLSVSAQTTSGRSIPST